MTTKTKPKPKPKKKPLSRKKPIEKKIPQLFIDSMGVKKSITIIVEGGIIQDIVKNACPNIKIQIHDYDLDTITDDENIYLDQYNKKFHLTEFE
jgi:hypothetical protein